MSFDALRVDPLSDSFFDSPGMEKDHARGRFYRDAVLDKAESEKQGAAIYKNVEMVEITHAGDRSYVHKEEVRDEHMKRWPREYRAFKEEIVAAVDGTPIEMWPPLTPADVRMLKAINVTTVEDLATVQDSNLASLGHAGRRLRDKAVAWLEAANKGAAGVQAEARANKLEAELEALKRQMAEMAAPKRGRRQVEEDADA